MKYPLDLRDSHLPALDGVRGLAILGPLAERFNLSATDRSSLEAVFCVVADHGWVGVQLFFVLSGMLITGILLDARDEPSYFRTFYVRRLLRIVPLYYATLLAALFFVPLIFSMPWPDARQIWLWLFLVNWPQAFGGELFGLPHFWSLAVEEQFYLVWPLVVLLLPQKRLVWLCTAVILAALGSRWYLATSGVDRHAIYVLTHCRMDALATGALVALALRSAGVRDHVARNRISLLYCSAAILVLGFATTSGFSRETMAGITAGYLLLAIVFGIWVTVAASADIDRIQPGFARFLHYPALRTLGKYSYGMYVLHVPVDRVLKPWFQQWSGTDVSFGLALSYMALAGGATLAVARVSFVLIERPFLKLKGRLAPYGSASPA